MLIIVFIVLCIFVSYHIFRWCGAENFGALQTLASNHLTGPDSGIAWYPWNIPTRDFYKRYFDYNYYNYY